MSNTLSKSVVAGDVIVTVDQGNTAVKLTVWRLDDSGRPEVEAHQAFSPSETDAMCTLIEGLEARGGIYCSVGRMDVRLVESLRCILGGWLIVLTPSTPLPIGVDYATPATLGMDRVAVAAGARALYPGERCMIADAGTAITTDVLSGEGDFKGGRISPGLELRFRALHDHTSRLPLEHPRAEVPEIGTDTSTSILTGVMRGAAAEIAESAIAYEASRLLMTGGDAAALLPVTGEICGRLGAPVPEILPRLLARGLVEIFLYNVDNLNDDNV